MFTYYSLSLEVALRMVGPGWADLVKECYQVCEEDELGEFYVIQVKEKWGGLCFYVEGISLNTWEKIDEICARSYAVCENCGKPGIPRKGSWIETLCNDCYAGRGVSNG